MEIALTAEAERAVIEAVGKPIEEIELSSLAVQCAACGSTFPLSEAHRESKGRCECGGELALIGAAAVRVKPDPQTIQITVVKDA